MSTIICPMLAALNPLDENGQAVNRECIQADCRFYNAEQQDCNHQHIRNPVLTNVCRYGNSHKDAQSQCRDAIELKGV